MSRLRAYAQLVRLPNVFTALADIGLGWLAARATGTPAASGWAFVLLLISSACLYTAGMVWNDFFDLEQDRRERPFRPLPSGRISRLAAGCLGGVLFLVGLGFASQAGWQDGTFRAEPLLLASLLVVAILLYDSWLKRTWVGPLAMGACRALNVLLGLSLARGNWPAPAIPWHLAAIVGVYIVGVTWFARTEARTSARGSLQGAALVMLTALALALAIPVWFAPGTTSLLYPYLLVAFGFFIGLPVREAIERPTPILVQRAVKRCILGLVILDAALATALAGPIGLLLLALLVPALYLGRWLYST